MHAALRDHLLFAAAFALLLALSLSGVEARAEGDLAPRARDLTALGDAPPLIAPPGGTTGDSCAAADPDLVGREYEARRAMLQRLAQATAAEGEGEIRVLDGRGYGYFPERNGAVDLARLQREAQLQARAQAPGRSAP